MLPRGLGNVRPYSLVGVDTGFLPATGALQIYQAIGYSVHCCGAFWPSRRTNALLLCREGEACSTGRAEGPVGAWTVSPPQLIPCPDKANYF